MLTAGDMPRIVTPQTFTNNYIVHPGKLTAGTSKWRFGSDDFPFQRDDFQVPAVNFPGSSWFIVGKDPLTSLLFPMVFVGKEDTQFIYYHHGKNSRCDYEFPL